MMNNSIIQLYGSNAGTPQTSTNERPDHMQLSPDQVTSTSQPQNVVMAPAQSAEHSLIANKTEVLHVPKAEDANHTLSGISEVLTVQDPNLRIGSISKPTVPNDKEKSFAKPKSEPRMKRGRRSLDEIADGDRPRRKRAKAKGQSSNKDTTSVVQGELEEKHKQSMCTASCTYIHYIFTSCMDHAYMYYDHRTIAVIVYTSQYCRFQSVNVISQFLRCGWLWGCA